jgi:hypothetical protein
MAKISKATAVIFPLTLLFVFGMARTSSTNTRASILNPAAETIRVRKVLDQFFSEAK